MNTPTVNPATGEAGRVYPEVTPSERAALLACAAAAFESWRLLSLGERAARFKSAGEVLRRGARELAVLIAAEMGKPVTQGRKEIEKCALVCDYYAEHAEKFLSPEPVKTEASKSYVAFEPLGTVLAVMPWNFPFWQVFRAAAPAMMAGNTMVLKHAINVPGCAVAIEKVFIDAGFPEGAFLNIHTDNAGVAAIIEHPAVKAVTLTGSVAAGRAVASKAGSMLKKTVLELGGSDPYLILADADPKEAAFVCGQSRMINSGQSCVAAKRFIVEEKVYDAFTQGLADYMKALKMGNPLEEGTEVGPLARLDLRDGVHRQVEESVRKGARLVTGGKRPEGPGAFYPPTVLADVKKGMPAFDEEVFGPVASVIKVRDENEAVRTANDSVFGLGSAVFTRDVKKGERIARELKAGIACVNAYVQSDPRLPFGGVEQSGYGRELGIFGIREFVNIKTVYVK
ncbi:MAG TPA: NAD-dependent succinate-semialdehyde dehydrogenase [Verrucomicrobiae bacterium]|jgi:succinate-semialdehyde dehydrogenase/glutarate-semialdehyde dehydrogenase|nr:NAD-dependent succinate-semialdehyde dehydrogenase [Verrucomicrobiae bacterium]